MVKLSLCMIVKNEEKNLPACLDSVKNVVDELVVMDTGSSDRTIEIAQSYGAKVPTFTWTNHFSAARNEALAHVTGDWVLVLDADETLEPKAVAAIQAAIANPKYLVVNLIRHEIGAPQSPYSLVSRLFRHHPQVFFDRPYHSIIDDSVLALLKKESQWQVVDLPEIAILHYGYSPEAIAALNKTDRARSAMEGFLALNPNDPYTCSKLGAIYVQQGNVSAGIKLFRRGLKANTASAHVLFELHYHLANASANPQNWESAIKHYQKAIAQPILEPLKLGAYNNLGGLYQTIGDLRTAEQYFEQTLTIDPNFAQGYYNLGIIYKALHQFERAIAVYQKAIAINPNYAEVYQNLGVVYYKIGQLAESEAAFAKAIRLFNQSQRAEKAQKLQQALQDLGLIVK
jgi:glycosyltransferase involved in cell wall biosynthesis